MASRQSAFNGLRHWLRSLFHRERAESELDSEVRFHLERHAEAKRAAGMSAEDARLAALREFGSVSLAKEEARDARGMAFLENTWQDFRHGLRTLRKNPGFTCVAVLTLALGIGANTAIFSVVNAVLLRPLPFPQSNRLVMVFATNGGNRQDVTSYPDFADWKEQSHSFEALAAFTNRTMTVSGANGAVLVRGIRPTPGFFEVLGVQPEIGRTFRNEESDPGLAHVAILSDAFWKSQFDGQRDILGQTLRINMSRSTDANTAYTVIGVMPPDFKISPEAQEQIYVPQVRDPDRGHGFLYVLGRLKPDISIAQAQSEMDAVTDHLAGLYPKFEQGAGANIVPLVDGYVGSMRPGLLLFLGVVALVLLIACTNVANLMLARGSARQKEIALRAALGAGRARLVRQLLTESTVLALAGGAFGLVVASWTVNLLVSALTKDFSNSADRGNAYGRNGAGVHHSSFDFDRDYLWPRTCTLQLEARFERQPARVQPLRVRKHARTACAQRSGDHRNCIGARVARQRRLAIENAARDAQHRAGIPNLESADGGHFPAAARVPLESSADGIFSGSAGPRARPARNSIRRACGGPAARRRLRWHGFPHRGTARSLAGGGIRR